MRFHSKRDQNSKISIVAGASVLIATVSFGIIFWFWLYPTDHIASFRYVSTDVGIDGEFGEPFGIVLRGSEIYVSDGQYGRILKGKKGKMTVFAEGLDTPSGIAFDQSGNLIIADSGSHTIRSIDPKGEMITIAGAEGVAGSGDGEALNARFNAPIGVAVANDGKILVSDTYNDRIRVIANGEVSTIVGSSPGYADGVGVNAKFHTPCGIAIWHDKLLVADSGNRRIRVVEPDGRVWTLAGNGEIHLKDGSLLTSSFVQPTAIAVYDDSLIFVADGNAIRQIGGYILPFVETISNDTRGIKDGTGVLARFNRPSGLALNSSGELLVADSDNRLIRRFNSRESGHEITADEIANLRDKPEEFRASQPPRWPYDPPDTKRDIAGTLGEIRGEIPESKQPARFHNGFDIAGSYGETARFIRAEKVLHPLAAENFGTLRELLRMPSLGYIHIRLGRDTSSAPFDDKRFQFIKDGDGKLTDIRIPRGTKFNAGESIGTLNQMNHVHLIAGRSGSEMNALDALVFPNLTDSRLPTIEKVTLFDENWSEIETADRKLRIKLSGKTRIVVRAYDQADGNSERRRLGVYQIGYQIMRSNVPLDEVKWTIRFDRMPSSDAIKLVYAPGSKSGATGETIFNYIATNYVDGDEFHEDFLDTTLLENGLYTLRVFAADYFGNTSFRDLDAEVLR